MNLLALTLGLLKPSSFIAYATWLAHRDRCHPGQSILISEKPVNFQTPGGNKLFPHCETSARCLFATLSWHRDHPVGGRHSSACWALGAREVSGALLWCNQEF